MKNKQFFCVVSRVWARRVWWCACQAIAYSLERDKNCASEGHGVLLKEGSFAQYRVVLEGTRELGGMSWDP